MASDNTTINGPKHFQDPESLQLNLIPYVSGLYFPSHAILGPNEEVALGNVDIAGDPLIANFFTSSSNLSVTNDDLAAIDSVMSPTASLITPTLIHMPISNENAESLSRSSININSAATSRVLSSNLERLSMQPQKRLKRSLSNVQERAHVCSTCHARFKIRGDLRRHIKAVHQGKREYSCSKCPQTFAHSGHRRRHYDSVHLRIRKHTCSTCGDSFFQASHLKSHIRHVHHHFKPWACEHCDIRFATESGLRNHMRTEHADETFHCPEPDCNESYGLASDLCRHCLQAHNYSP